MNNIVNMYTDYVLKQFSFYAKEIMGKFYIASIFNDLAQEYINIRYYNMYPAKQNNKTTISYYLNLKIKELTENNKDKVKNITFMVDIFNYLIYLDSELEAAEVNKVEKELSNLIKTKYDLDEALEFSKKYREFKKEKKEFFKAYETNDFVLEINNIKNRLFNANLKYEIEFPELYSQKAINDTYNSGLVNEDKLFVLYNLVGIKVLNEIIDYNYLDCYLVDFNIDLLNKKDKISRLLKIIDNDITKEKVCFKIKYTEFKTNKDAIFGLINNGFNFALIKDENYKDEFHNLFKYVLEKEV